ncbi:hypothetical protein [Enterococcus casseliflavus]|uniref:hypothetical protein n=1 Tax=Enterococcus casseliflavus TaxID=37734 RepID=UPI003D0BE297
MTNVTFQSYPLQVQNEVQQMNEVFDTPEKRSYVADKARIHLSAKTKSDVYSEAYAHLIKFLGLTSNIQDGYTQKLVAFYLYAQQVYFNGKSMLDDFVNNGGKLPHFFTSYR